MKKEIYLIEKRMEYIGLNLIRKKKSMTIILFHILWLNSMTFSYAQSIKIQKVDIAKPEKVTRDGVFYALPKTILIIDVSVTKTMLKAPTSTDKCDAACRRALQDIGFEIYKTDRSYKIADYSITTKAIPDLNEVYLINPRKKWNKNSNMTFSLSEQGLIKGAEVSVENKTINVITSGIKTIGSIAGSIIASRDKLGASSSLIKLIQLIDKREALISSSRYASSLEVIKYQVSELDKLIANELEELIGIKKEETKIFRFLIDPDCPTFSPPNTYTDIEIDLFCVNNIGSDKGIFLSTKSEGVIYPIDFMTTKKEGELVKLSIMEPRTKDYGSLLMKTTESTSDKKGFPYRIPKNKIVSITLAGKPTLISTIPVPQCGVIAYLPYKMDKVNATFYENLGNLQSISTDSKAIFQSSNIESIQGTFSDIKSLIDGKSELDNLNEENALLEAKKKNKELKDAL
ncbi:DUF4831 family protein [Confluentibacter flavum]|uniref:DUF4831 domain-containing protein n=1 Tax=Confluentibacter flavum TaxID=1909700 RepID=A0A2N3HH09_9FLAO|nr:DUF4831 family protein [Confluentibacter flavum]PKQ44203.1 hypothetical protein CSW08_13960 [Confluentibacter flavum]